MRFAGLFCLVTAVLALAAVPAVCAFELENVMVWTWTSDTECQATAAGDIDGDQSVEILTGGYYYDGTRAVAQLCVWSGSTLALENIMTWYWTSDTFIYSVAVGDVDGDGSVEIVTGGCYDAGEGYNAQLCVWSGSTLALEQVTTWHWAESTELWAVAVGDVDGDGSVEIVTGGNYYDGTRAVAQLCVWSGSTLTLENVQTWYWTSHTEISSVAVGDVDGDQSAEIVTCGYHVVGHNSSAQLCVWSGSTLALEQVTTWYWTYSTFIRSVAVGDVDADQSIEIVTGGDYSANAQLCVWSGSTLTLENVKTWYWTSTTYIRSVVVDDVDGDASVEIVTGGDYYDGVHTNAQLCVWSGSTLALEDVTTWYWEIGTYIYSVAASDVDNDDSVETVTGGIYWDTEAINAQLTVWISQPDD